MTLMAEGVWSADFSYAYLTRIFLALKARRMVRRFCDAPAVLEEQGSPAVFLRHDLDVDLGAALRMARLEESLGIQATYMVMPSARLYPVSSPDSVNVLKQIRDAGHEIGVHVDYEASPANAGFSDALTQACGLVGGLLPEPVRSFSVHRPVPEALRGPLIVAGCVNAYAAPLMESYLSDSAGVWRAGEPLAAIGEMHGPVLQVLIHPIWWGPEHAPAAERLEDYRRERLRMDRTLDPAALDEDLRCTVPRVFQGATASSNRA